MPFARSIFAVLLASLLGPLVATAAKPVTLKLTVHGDGVARHNAPVTARIDAKLPISGVMPATLTSNDGFDVSGQVESAGDAIIVRWVEPSLSADVAKTYTLTVGSAKPQAAAFDFETGDGFRDLLLGDRPVYRHMNKYDPADRDNTSKPFYHVYGFHGDGFITKGAGGKYPHHRGLFFGFKTPQGDFWHCKDVTLQHRKYDEARELLGPVASRGVSITEWIDKDGKPVVRDTQEVTAWDVGAGRLILDFDITVESLTGQTIPIGGDAHHAGFHFRAAQEVAEVTSDTDKQGGGTVYTRPAGAKHLGNDVWENIPWLDGAFSIKGNRYGVTHMDAPSNPRPTTYSSRGYGRFGAYFAIDVAPDKPLRLRYRIAVRDAGAGGEVSPEQLDAPYQDFAKPARVSVAQ